MQDRPRSIIDVLVDIDDPAAGAELARRAHLSRFHFNRVTAAILGESPAAFRRRLLLERAAYELARGTTVTDAVTTRLIEHHNRQAERLIEAAATHDDDVLDEPVVVEPRTPAFADESPTIRSMLNRLVHKGVGRSDQWAGVRRSD